MIFAISQKFDELCRDFVLSELEDSGVAEREERIRQFLHLKSTLGLESWNANQSTTASLEFGILRATKMYKKDSKSGVGCYTQRFDCVQMQAGDEEEEWYGQIRLFVQIKDFQGVLVRWYDDAERLSSMTYSFLKPLQWWRNSSGNIRYTVTSIHAIRRRVHVVPDFSYNYRYKITYQEQEGPPLTIQRFLLNTEYII